MSFFVGDLYNVLQGRCGFFKYVNAVSHLPENRIDIRSSSKSLFQDQEVTTIINKITKLIKYLTSKYI